jgi:hypothetical protein
MYAILPWWFILKKDLTSYSTLKIHW